MFAGADPDIPQDCWDLLLDQSDTMLNMSQESNINPRVNTYTLINGTYNFNTNLMSPVSCKAIVHDRAYECASWAQHGSRGFCIGPALKHWCCYHIYMIEIKSIQVSNTVEFFPQKCSNLIINEEKQIRLLLDDLVNILSKSTRTIPSITYSSELNDVLCMMQQLMCKDGMGKQKCVGVNQEEQRVKPVREWGPRTRSQNFVHFPVGTIIWKKFGNGKFY